MLEGLDQVDWKNVQSFGSSLEIPQYIRQLISNDLEAVKHAQDKLYALIWSRDYISDCASYIPPFLLQIVKLNPLHVLHTLELIRPLVGSQWSYFGHPAASQAEEFILKAGYSIYQDLLKHDDLHVRINTIAIISCFLEHTQELCALLYELFQAETEYLVRDEIIFNLSSLLMRFDENEQIIYCSKLSHYLLPVYSDKLRIYVAHLIMCVLWGNTPNIVLDTMLEISTSQDAEFFHDSHFDIAIDALDLLERRHAIPTMIKLLPLLSEKAYEREFKGLIRVMVSKTFSSLYQQYQDEIERQELQNATILALLECNRIWQSSELTNELAMLMNYHEFPVPSNNLRQYLLETIQK